MTKKIFGVFLILFFVRIHSGFGATFTVTNNGDSGPGTLRQAILDANGTLGSDVISFGAPFNFNITLFTALPVISDPVFIDGPVSGSPQIQINGNFVGGQGLLIAASAAGTVIKGLNIYSHSNQGILIAASNVFIIGCYIGTDINGLIDNGNRGTGIELAADLTNIQIGGSTIDSANLISGNGAPLFPAHGINIGPRCSNIRIFNNKIGVSSNGNNAIANSLSGITVNENTNLIIRGNIVSGNDLSGIEINKSTQGLITDNIVGLSVDGNTPLGNKVQGIQLTECQNFLIGGISTGKNIISNNGIIGILISACSNIAIKSNYIGTNANGTVAIGNGSNGIQLQGQSNGIIIGGSRITEGNIISSSLTGAGISFEYSNIAVENANGTIIKGNLIGTDITGNSNNTDLGNRVIGIILKSNNCIIGNDINNEGNVIGGSKNSSGILIANGNNNTIRGNYIGVGLDGTTPIGNMEDGITIVVETPGQTAMNNIVEQNSIAYNKRYGVNIGRPLGPITVPPATPSNAETGNNIRLNKIYCNQEKGIFLYLSEPADQGNNGNPAPIINYTESNGTKIKGTSGPGQTIDIYAIVDCISCNFNPQGKEFIGTVTANGVGIWEYNSTLPPGQMLPDQITATATDNLNNTSEFSLCCQAIAGFLQGPSEVCVEKEFILSAEGQLGDNIMLQKSSTPDGIYTNVESKILSDPINFSAIQIVDTTYFRVISYSQGTFANAACKDTSSIIRVNPISKPVAGIATITPSSICEGESFTLSLSGFNGNIQWQRSYRDDNGVFFNIDGANGVSFNVSPSISQSPVAFQAVISNSACPSVTSNLVGGSVSNATSGGISGPTKVCNGEDALLTINGTIGNIQWQDSTEGRSWTDIPQGIMSPLTYTPPAVVSTTYLRLVVQDWNGTCKDTSAIHTLISDSCLVAPDLIFPNGLTPNGDNQNDVFYIYNIWEYPGNHITIYNRWGSIVYEADGYINTWDGTHNGNPLPVSTYYYVLELGPDKKGNMNSVNKYSGSVTIVR